MGPCGSMMAWLVDAERNGTAMHTAVCMASSLEHHAKDLHPAENKQAPMCCCESREEREPSAPLSGLAASTHSSTTMHIFLLPGVFQMHIGTESDC